MAWTELTDLRNRRSRTYQDDANPLKRAWSGTLAPLHYESQIGSDIYDAEVNMTPQRIDNPLFDGWRITTNGWHYALGKDLASHGNQDGWVGFGGRKGAHWFKFRLLRVGYLHWPTRAWDDIGGAPNYDRANLNRQTHSLTIGPNQDPLNVATVATWSNIWTTPATGHLSISWRVNGDRLKELVTINQAGRDWIRDNRPPATPPNETWFGFAFRLDWSDIPHVYRARVLQDADGDFADDDESIELRDALDRLLAFMPLSTVTVPRSDPGPPQREQLRKRFWKDGGDYYMLLGIRCDRLNSLPTGDLVFDPTVNTQIPADADDGVVVATPCSDHIPSNAYIMVGDWTGTPRHSWVRLTGVTIAGTITTSYIQVYEYGSTGTPALKVYGIDEDNPAAPANCSDWDTDAGIRTSAAVDWDGVWSGTWNNSPSLNGIFQELVDSYTISNDAVMLQIIDDGSPGSEYNAAYDYTTDSAKATKLHIEYTITTAFPPVPGAVHRLRRLPHLRM